jgi:putative membrane-bound dehydrogenase-like protein
MTKRTQKIAALVFGIVCLVILLLAMSVPQRFLSAPAPKSAFSVVVSRAEGTNQNAARRRANGRPFQRVSPESLQAMNSRRLAAELHAEPEEDHAPRALAARQRSDEKYDAQWVWYDSGKPDALAPKGKAWFRREVRAGGPSTGAVRLLCDDRCTLWLNGQKVGEGTSKQVSRFSLNGMIGGGLNVIAVEAESRGGNAGLFLDGEILNQDGDSIPLDTGNVWMATTAAPSGTAWLEPKFDTTSWKPVKILGPHAQPPWKALILKDTVLKDTVLQETDLDRFHVPKGFELTRVADPNMVGSLIAMTWGERGRLIASRENGPILSVIDDNGDGIYDRVEDYCREVTNCQGLSTVGEDLYAVGSGPKGVGIYRLSDKNHDGKADEIELIHRHKENMGEHGPHDVVFGPDGWLYYNMGNHGSMIEAAESTTACRDYGEDYLLQPKFEDPAEQFPGLKAPGGTIWRFTPDGKRWWCETNGFRNEYDFAFNAAGDMFSVDSDSESEEGAYFYRPVRVNHCTAGAEFGWRAGTSNRPPYYFDSLPGTVDVGRGSPTGVVFYEHTQFPPRFRGALLVGDWSMGRILAVHLKKSGASYAGTFETILSGAPLNVCDIEVDRDGSIVFVTGGRNTEGGIYRLRYTAGSKRPADASTVAELLVLPQIEAAWAREIAARVKATAGKNWESALTSAVISGTPETQIRALTLLNQLGPRPDLSLLLEASQAKDATVRAFVTHLLGFHTGDELRPRLARLLSDPDATVRRRACEAFVRSGIEGPVDGLLAAMGSADRWERFAARLALERVPREKWFDEAVHSPNLHVVFGSLLAVYRRDRENSAETILKTIAPILCEPKIPLSTELRLNALRLVQLALLQGTRNAASAQIGRVLFDQFPTGQTPVDAETAEILAALNFDGAVGKLMPLVEKARTHGEQLHYAMTLRYLGAGWNFDLKHRLMQWYEGTREWEGGSSLVRYVYRIVGITTKRFTPLDRKNFLREGTKRPAAATLILSASRPAAIADFERTVADLIDECGKTNESRHDELIEACMICQADAGSRSFRKAFRASLNTSSLRQKIYRALYERKPDSREFIAREIAANPAADDWPVLVRTLRFADRTTMQRCLEGLGRIGHNPNDANAYRAVIEAGLTLGDRGGQGAANLLRSWTGVDPNAHDDAGKALAFYQKWYKEKFPTAPAAELPTAAAGKSKYTFQQLVTALEHGAPGRAERGRKVFTKAQCVKCHRFQNEGEPIGPDLSSARRHLQRKEIVESVVFPSAVISDRYRMIQVRTKEGGVYTGMPLPGAARDDKLVLFLSDARKLEIAKERIEEQTVSNVSLMPAGLLDALTSEEVADLFAFLETSKVNLPAVGTRNDLHQAQ